MIEYLTRSMMEQGRTLKLTATTGIAAVNINGQTIHTASGLGFGQQTPHELKRLAKAPWTFKKWEDMKPPGSALLIDEISMLSPDYFIKLDDYMRLLFDARDPFGGKQIIVVGDFAQLPPVNKDSVGGYKYCFQTPSWESAGFKTVHLDTVHRQHDHVFVDLLNRCRFGQMVDRDYSLLETRVGVDVSRNGIKPTHLYSHNVDVDAINVQRLHELPGDPVVFRAFTSTTNDKDQDCTRALEALIKSVPVTPEIRLKVGSQVILAANVDVSRGFCNGARGVVVAFTGDDDSPIQCHTPSCFSIQG